MADCPAISYFDSPEFVINTLHCLTLVDIPILIFGGYCVMFKTPNSMKQVKRLMVILHFTIFLSDIAWCILGVPYILYPTMAGYGLGLIDSPGFMFYCGITLIASYSSMIVTVYENRYFILFGSKTWWRKARKSALLAMYTLVPLFFLPPYFNIPDQEFGKKQVFQSLPCLTPFTYSNREMYVMALDYKLPCIGVAFMACSLGTFAATFFFLITWHLFNNEAAARQRRMSISTRTQRSQKTFFLAFTIQSVYGITSLLTPVAIVLTTVLVWYHNQALNNIVFIVLSLHGIGSTIVMIMVHKPYRDFTFRMFLRQPSSEAPSFPVSQISVVQPKISSLN